jgi:hypothetical protein
VRFFYPSFFPESYTTEKTSQKADVVHAHIFRVYNTASPEIYAAA